MKKKYKKVTLDDLISINKGVCQLCYRKKAKSSLGKLDKTMVGQFVLACRTCKKKRRPEKSHEVKFFPLDKTKKIS